MKLLLLSILALSLCSCTSFVPVETQNGKALGVMPMQYGRISYQGTHKINASRPYCLSTKPVVVLTL
jgi:hypothetical protein